MNIDRDAARQHLQRGHPVLVNGTEVRPVVGAGGFVRNVPALPNAEDKPAFVALRSETGDLNRAGMEHIIRNGGSVMIGSQIIDNLADLPPEDVLAAGDERRLKSAIDAADEKIAVQMRDKERALKALEDARQKAAQKAAEPAEEEKPKHPAQHAPQHPGRQPGRHVKE